VLGDRRAAYWQQRGQFADRLRPFEQQIEDRLPGRVAQDDEEFRCVRHDLP